MLNVRDFSQSEKKDAYHTGRVKIPHTYTHIYTHITHMHTHLSLHTAVACVCNIQKKIRIDSARLNFMLEARKMYTFPRLWRPINVQKTDF